MRMHISLRMHISQHASRCVISATCMGLALRCLLVALSAAGGDLRVALVGVGALGAGSRLESFFFAESKVCAEERGRRKVVHVCRI